MTVTRTDAANSLRQTSRPLPRQVDDSQFMLPSLMARAGKREEAYTALTQWLQARPGYAASGFYIRDGDTVTVGPHCFTGPAFENEQFLQTAKDCAEVASRNATIHTTAVERIRNLMLVSVPVEVGPRHFDSLTAAVVVGDDTDSEFTSLHLAATNASLWHSQQRQTVVSEHLKVTAAAMDLLGTIQSCDTFRSGCISLVNTLRAHLACQGIVLGLTRSNGLCDVTAMSGLADFDSNAFVMQAIKDALEECVVRDRLSVFPCPETSDRDTLLSHRKLTHDLQAKTIISHPLRTTAGDTVGAWLAIEDGNSENQETLTLLRTAATPIAETLLMAKRADRSFSFRGKRSVGSVRRLLRVVVGLAITAAVLMIPLPYQIHCECLAEPDVRRFVVAPHEGLIEKTYVKAGDSVHEGQLLARMDGRDVRWELAGIMAEQEKAKKDQDAGLLTGDVAAAQRAALEMKQLEARSQILTRQTHELEIRSPITGLVLDGYLDRVENAPVNIGQSLYEVAPLTPVAVEVAIPDDQHPHVQPGFEVTVRFEGVNAEFTGTVHQIQPRSEVLDDNNVFIADVLIQNADERLRPGMKGYARIKGETKSLAWCLFHKPWEHVRKWLPF